MVRNNVVGFALAAACAACVASAALATTFGDGPGMAHSQRPVAPDGGRGWAPGGPDGGRGGPPSPERMFAEMDANRDGMVSKAEFTSFHARHRGPGGRGPGGRDDGPPPRGDRR